MSTKNVNRQLFCFCNLFHIWDKRNLLYNQKCIEIGFINCVEKMNLPLLKPLERSAFGFFYGGKITFSYHLIKQKCCIWGSGSLWTQRTDDQIFKELQQNFLVLVQLYPGTLRKNSEIIYGERLQPTHICFFSHLFHTFIFSAIDCFVCFISTDDSLNALSSLGKNPKSSQGTDDMTENYAGMFIMNNEYYVNDIAGEEMF